MRSSTSFPGRDGLLHISKLGQGKRIDRVEDVLNLGDEVTVRVDDIDNSGKLSLSMAGDEPAPSGGGESGSGGGDRGGEGRGGGESRGNGDRAADRGPRERSVSGGSGESASDSGVEVASFDDAWDSKAREEFGDLGPAEAGRPGGGDRGGERRGGGGGGGRRRRR